MRQTRRSVWHDRGPVALASKSGRPRSCPQWLWYWVKPGQDRSCMFRNGGWSGARDRDKPRKTRYQYVLRGKWLGGLIRYDDDGRWLAYVCGHDGGTERSFWHRRDAKRWVEVEAARRSER